MVGFATTPRVGVIIVGDREGLTTFISFMALTVFMLVIAFMTLAVASVSSAGTFCIAPIIGFRLAFKRRVVTATGSSPLWACTASIVANAT